MQNVDANKLFDQARALHQGVDESGTPITKDLDEALRLYNLILDHNPGNPLVTYCIGTVFMERNQLGLALMLLQYVTENAPEMPEPWNNLGLVHRGLRRKDVAETAFKRGLEAVPSDPQFDYVRGDIYSNLAGMHINEGTPLQGIEYARKSLEYNPKHVKSMWHLALTLLEDQRWDEAWGWHEIRLQEDSANYNIAQRNYAAEGDPVTPWWDGKSPGLIAIHGEQGLGDEIMFASCIADMMKVPGTSFVLEPSPRMHQLYARSFSDCKVYGTNEVDGAAWVGKHGRPDYKVALGSLPRFCRLSEEDFPGTPFIVPNPKRAKIMRQRLDTLGPRPKIGVTWQGGVESTAVHLRSLWPRELAPLLELDADFISLQYTDDAALNVKQLKDETGLTIHHWPDVAEAQNIDRLCAMISELDMVVSVCQSAVHFAGAMGIPTLCLTPAKPSWRYGVHGNMPWYASVDLIRQTVSEEWGPAVEEAASRVQAFIEKAATNEDIPRIREA